MGLDVDNWLEGSYLARAEEVDINVGVSGDRVNAVLAEVFTHILRGGLRQQPINAFSARTYNKLLRAVTSTIHISFSFDNIPIFCQYPK